MGYSIRKLLWGYFCLHLLFSAPLFSQTVSEEWLKSEYLLLLSSYVSWEDEPQIDTFLLGVVSSDPIYTELSFRSESQVFKEKPFQVYFFKKPGDIRPVNILYIGEERNSSMKKIWNRWKSEPVLVVTDSSKYEYSMINLLGMNLGGKPFEINKSNIDGAGLIISSKILAVGGSEEDLRRIYRESEKQLEQLTSDIAGLNEELLQKQAELEKTSDELRGRMQEIADLSEEIRQQTGQLTDLR